jgi:hypothetical protein
MRSLVIMFSLLFFWQSTFAKSGSRIENLAACLQAIDDANQEAARKFLKENEGLKFTEAERQKAQQATAERAKTTSALVQKCITAKEANHIGHLSYYSDGWLKRCGLAMKTSLNFDTAAKYFAISDADAIQINPFFQGQEAAASISRGVKVGTPQAALLCGSIKADFGSGGAAIRDAVQQRVPKLASSIDFSELDADPARDGAAYYAADFLAKVCGAIKTKNHAALKRRNRESLMRFDEQGRTLLATMAASCSLEGGNCPNYTQEKCNEALLEYGDGEVSDEYKYRSILKFE